MPSAIRPSKRMLGRELGHPVRKLLIAGFRLRASALFRLADLCAVTGGAQRPDDSPDYPGRL